MSEDDGEIDVHSLLANDMDLLKAMYGDQSLNTR